MQILIIHHPETFSSKSMPKFADYVANGMRARGHSVSTLTSRPFMSRLCAHAPVRARKWLNYFDQFVLFPSHLDKALRGLPSNALVVVTDQALGMWVPKIQKLSHVVHCHDFLAQRSALGEIPENPVALTGRIYQKLIRRGYRQAEHFISVSARTQKDLHLMLGKKPLISEVVHNGLNGPFRVLDSQTARTTLCRYLLRGSDDGSIIHVGGNQWYKNRDGVLKAYIEYCKMVERPRPLWLVGTPPTRDLKSLAATIPPNGSVAFMTDLANEEVVAAYNLASVLLFPSLEEGFGWPIIEAMACGTRVITTANAPMSEVGSNVAYYVPRRTIGDRTWSAYVARILVDVLAEDDATTKQRVELGLKYAKQFDPANCLNQIERIYRRIIADR